MMTKLSISEKFNHLVKVISSERFLTNKLLFKEVPCFIADYDIKEQAEFIRLQEQLINNLENKNIKILNINLYDLVISILKDTGDWDWYIEHESEMQKDEFLEALHSLLDIETVIVPEISKKMQNSEFDVMFITGVGEVFPYIRSHTILTNLHKFIKDKPTLMFFPGEYKYSENRGSNFSLFNKFPEDREYRATNIFEIKEV